MSTLRWIHRWLGLAVLPVFIVTCLTGTLLVFQKPLLRWLVTPSAELPPNYDAADVASGLEHLSQHPAFRRDDLIKAPNPQEPYWTLSHRDGTKQLLDLRDFTLYSDRQWVLDVFEFIRHLHIELMLGLAGKIVLLILGCSALFFCISGIYLWWPMRRIYGWRWVLPPPSFWRLKWLLRFHSHSGITLVAILLISFTTSTTMMWRKVDFGMSTSEASAADETYAPVTPSQLATGLRIADLAVKDSWPTFIRTMPGDTPMAKIRVRMNGEWHPNGRTNIYVNLAQAKITRLQRVEDATPLQRVLNQMYPLHSGYGLPLFYAIIVFVGGAGALWLAVSGAINLLRREMSLKRRRQLSKMT